MEEASFKSRKWKGEGGKKNTDPFEGEIDSFYC